MSDISQSATEQAVEPRKISEETRERVRDLLDSAKDMIWEAERAVRHDLGISPAPTGRRMVLANLLDDTFWAAHYSLLNLRTAITLIAAETARGGEVR